MTAPHISSVYGRLTSTVLRLLLPEVVMETERRVDENLVHAATRRPGVEVVIARRAACTHRAIPRRDVTVGAVEAVRGCQRLTGFG